MKKAKLYFKKAILIVLASICILFFAITAYFLYKKDSGYAGVFATLMGIPLTIFIAIVPVIFKKWQGNGMVEKQLNDVHFVDRDVEYTKLANLIQCHDDRIIYIAGNFGMGKTLFIKMACDRINYSDKKRWKSYTSFYFNNNHTKGITQSISDKFCGQPNASVLDISKKLHNATLQKNIILFIDSISEIDLNECTEFARAFIKCNRNNQIVIAVDSNDDEFHISPGKFQENEVELLAHSYDIEMKPSDIYEISELSNGYPVYARYSVEAYRKGVKIADYNNLDNYIAKLVDSLNDLEKSSLSLIICLGLLLQDEIETKLLLGVDNRISRRIIRKLATYSLINIYKEKIYTDRLISLKCLECLAEYKNASYEKIYNYFKGMLDTNYIALVAALKSDFSYDHRLIKEILHKQYDDGKFYLLIDIGEIEFAGQINPHLREDKECWMFVRYYYLKSLLELGLYDRAREVVDNYDIQFNLLDIKDDISFEYQYLLVDLDHLTNYLKDAIAFSEGLMQKSTNNLQLAKCQYLFAHCLQHVGEELDRAFAIFTTLADNIDYKDDKIRIRSIYSAASIKMFQGNINYPYEKAFEKIEQIMNADEKNVTWMPYVARHKAIYEYKICKNIDNAEQILLDTIKLLEVTPLRIKYDIYFELADIYRLKECTVNNYESSVNYYLEAAQFAKRSHDYNLESNAQLGLALLNLKYGYDVDIDALRDIIIETHKIGLNINYNNALYVKYLANSETIPKELVSYWKKMQYSDLLSFISKSKSEKYNIKLTVM